MVSQSLNAWMNGERVGTWLVDRNSHAFRYAPSWLESPRRRSLSLSLLISGSKRVDASDSVQNEWLCAQIVGELGLPVASTSMETDPKCRKAPRGEPGEALRQVRVSTANRGGLGLYHKNAQNPHGSSVSVGRRSRVTAEVTASDQREGGGTPAKTRFRPTQCFLKREQREQREQARKSLIYKECGVPVTPGFVPVVPAMPCRTMQRERRRAMPFALALTLCSWSALAVWRGADGRPGVAGLRRWRQGLVVRYGGVVWTLTALRSDFLEDATGVASALSWPEGFCHGRSFRLAIQTHPAREDLDLRWRVGRPGLAYPVPRHAPRGGRALRFVPHRPHPEFAVPDGALLFAHRFRARLPAPLRLLRLTAYHSRCVYFVCP